MCFISIKYYNLTTWFLSDFTLTKSGRNTCFLIQKIVILFHPAIKYSLIIITYEKQITT